MTTKIDQQLKELELLFELYADAMCCSEGTIESHDVSVGLSDGGITVVEKRVNERIFKSCRRYLL